MTCEKIQIGPFVLAAHAAAGMAHKGDTFPESNRVIAAAAAIALKSNLVLWADDFVFNLHFN